MISYYYHNGTLCRSIDPSNKCVTYTTLRVEKRSSLVIFAVFNYQIRVYEWYIKKKMYVACVKDGEIRLFGGSDFHYCESFENTNIINYWPLMNMIL